MLRFLKENKIHLEVCPTSNVQSNVFDKIENHSGNRIYDAGVSMSINTDGRTLSDITLAYEYELMERVFYWDRQHFKKCNLEAIDHAFSTEDIKEKIRRRIEKAY